MNSDTKYDVSSLVEAQFQPGSREQVLRNRPGIIDPQEMDRVEVLALETAMKVCVGRFDAAHRFIAMDICKMHKIWLGEIYEWAGNYRQVNLSKGDFPFAAANQVPALMARFEHEILKRVTPCNFKDREKVVPALAESHVEVVLIHPFRDGNGRVARMLSTLMALQADLPLLDFGPIVGTRRGDYFQAVQAGMDRNYKPMERLFAEIIERAGAAS